MIEMLMSGFTFVEPSTASGLVFRTQSEALRYQSLHEPTGAEEILDNWPRISDRTWIADPADATGASAEWYYDAVQDSFVQPLNVAGSEFIVTPFRLSSYVLDMILTSPGGDDDCIGAVAAMDLVDGNVTFLTYWIQMEKTDQPTASLRFGDETNGDYVHYGGLGDIIVGTDLLSRGGWSGKKVRVRITKSGGVVTAFHSDWDSTELLPASEVSVNLNELPRKGNELGNASRYGFGTNSQADSTYLNYTIRSPEIEDDSRIYAENTNERWIYEFGAWVLDGTAHQDFSDVDRVNNRLTKEVFDVNTTTLQFRRNDGIPYGSPTLIAVNGQVSFTDILAEFPYAEILSVVGAFDGGTLEADHVAVLDTSGTFVVMLASDEVLDPETGITSQTIAFRTINYTS